MKHTTFENELRDIRRRATQELYEAIKAHNGEINFTKYDKCPILDREKVCEIRAFDDISFIDTEYSYLTSDDIAIEDILYIIGTIPETDEVKDVSGVYSSPVLWLDTDDIESCGFDSNCINQDTLDEMGVYLAGYFDDSFQCALIETCRHYGLKEKED